MNKNETFIAKTFHGLEEILAAELIALGALNVNAHKRAVSFEGNIEMLYKVNFSSRLSLRILKPIAKFTIQNEDDLYKKCYRLEWDKYFTYKQSFSIDEQVTSTIFRHTKFAAYRVKDAIADAYRDKHKFRPPVDTENPDIRINLHIYNETCTISLDSSGEPLFKRGYRTSGGEAPLNEVLAAGLIQLSGWDKKTPFYDFMCGSGTIPIEASMYANNVPAGILRKEYSFMKWKDYDEKLFKTIKTAELAKISKQQIKIVASDVLPQAVALAKRNASELEKPGYINLNYNTGSFFKLKQESDNGIIIINPPYDERLKTDDINSFYKTIGDTLKNNFSGFTAWIFSGNSDAYKSIGLRPSRKIALFNGKLECKLLKFQMYAGSKKHDFQQNDKA